MKLNKNYKSIAIQAVGITGGQIAANAAGKALNGLSFIPEAVKPYATGGLQAIAGIVIASKAKGKTGSLIASAGVGMASQGIKTILSKFIPNLVSGVGNANKFIPYQTVGAVATNPFNTAAETLGGFASNSNGEGTFAE